MVLLIVVTAAFVPVAATFNEHDDHVQPVPLESRFAADAGEASTASTPTRSRIRFINGAP